jgi:hypothetical protein
MIPAGLTRLIRQSPTSVIYKLPLASMANARGKLKPALTAKPPSPENTPLPLPAMVAMAPALPCESAGQAASRRLMTGAKSRDIRFAAHNLEDILIPFIWPQPRRK